jgi:hypothetical protein
MWNISSKLNAVMYNEYNFVFKIDPHKQKSLPKRQNVSYLQPQYEQIQKRKYNVL